MIRKFYVYLITNSNNTVIYCGVTNDIYQRQQEHEKMTNKFSFTAKYKCIKIVYFEVFDKSIKAIAREKQIKKRSRQYKINLIESINPEWKDILSQDKST
jgi:putative endonuclease